MYLLRLLTRITFIFILIVSYSASHAQSYYIEKPIIIANSGITLIIPADELETKASTLSLSRISFTGDYLLSWGAPVYDTAAYTFETDATLLQEKGLDGEWQTIPVNSYQRSGSKFTASVKNKQPAIYEYRLLRQYSLNNINSGKQEKFAHYEELTPIIVSESALLPAENVIHSIVTLPSKSIDGDYVVKFAPPSTHKFSNGKTYSLDYEYSVVEYSITNIDAGTVLKGDIKLDDQNQVQLADQAPGTYEVIASVTAKVEFSDDYELTEEHGGFDFGVDDALNSDDFRKIFKFISEQPQRIVVENITPEELIAQVGQFGNVYLTWPTDLASNLNEIEVLGEQGWRLVYRGSGSSYLATNVEPGEQQFRIRSCEGDYVCTNYIAQSVQVDSVIETECTPFNIDEGIQ